MNQAAKSVSHVKESLHSYIKDGVPLQPKRSVYHQLQRRQRDVHEDNKVVSSVERTGETFPASTAAPAQRREEMEMNLSRFTCCAFLKRLVWK